MSFIQWLFIKFLPKPMAREMEMESRSWVMQCPHCENEVSYWDIGGIRWRATGNQRNLLRCRACGKRGWQRSYRKPEVPVPLQRDADLIETTAVKNARKWGHPQFVWRVQFIRESILI